MYTLLLEKYTPAEFLKKSTITAKVADSLENIDTKEHNHRFDMLSDLIKHGHSLDVDTNKGTKSIKISKKNATYIEFNKKLAVFNAHHDKIADHLKTEASKTKGASFSHVKLKDILEHDKRVQAGHDESIKKFRKTSGHEFHGQSGPITDAERRAYHEKHVPDVFSGKETTEERDANIRKTRKLKNDAPITAEHIADYKKSKDEEHDANIRKFHGLNKSTEITDKHRADYAAHLNSAAHAYKQLHSHEFKVGNSTTTYTMSDLTKHENFGSSNHSVEERNRKRIEDHLNQHKGENGITVNINGILHHNVHSIIKSKRPSDNRETKSDFTLLDKDGNHIAHISHKGESFQQYGGFSKESLGEHGIDREDESSGHHVIRKFYNRVREMVGKGEHGEASTIFQKLNHNDKDHQMLAKKMMFGRDYGHNEETGVDNADHVIHGELGFRHESHPDHPHGILHIMGGTYKESTNKNDDSAEFHHVGTIITNHHTTDLAKREGRYAPLHDMPANSTVLSRESNNSHHLPEHHMPSLVWRHGTSSSFADHKSEDGNVTKLGGRAGGFKAPTTSNSIQIGISKAASRVRSQKLGNRLFNTIKRPTTAAIQLTDSLEVSFSNLSIFNESYVSVEEDRSAKIVTYYNSNLLENFHKFERLANSVKQFYNKDSINFSKIDTEHTKNTNSLYAILESNSDSEKNLHLVLENFTEDNYLLIQNYKGRYKSITVYSNS